jgi:hypothetical protein
MALTSNFISRGKLNLLASALATAALLSACGGDDAPLPVVELTPKTLQLEKIGQYASGVFGESAAEIPAYDAASKRVFVVNSFAGKIDVLDMSNPTAPRKIAELNSDWLLAGSRVNSVAAQGGIVAVAIEAVPKTNPGRVAFYKASDLSLLSHVEVGALPDMLIFTPDSKTVLVANEGEPSDDYQIDPEGSVSIIDISKIATPTVKTAGFAAFNGKEAELRAKGVRIFGPGANAAKDFEPEYIAVSADGKTAWAALQENNALAKIDIASATVTDILPLGYKDHGVAGNEIDVSDEDGKTINIKTWAGVHGMYQPDAMVSYSVGGKTYLVSANEGDARAWGEDNPLYWGTEASGATPAVPGNASKGYVEEFRVKHLINKNGWSGREFNDLPPQLKSMAAGALLNPATFGYCGATEGEPGVASDPGDCREDEQLGRLKITWTKGYQTNPDGTPKMFTAEGVADPTGDRLMYDKLYSYGARSFSIWDENGKQIWDSGAEFEKFLASDDCKLGSKRNIPCANYFNSGHDEGNAKDSRSDAKGPEPEGVTIGSIGAKTFAFIGLERMGGVLVYDITNPTAPFRVDYLNPRDEWENEPEVEAAAGKLAAIGDLGPEGLVFVPAAQSPNGKPLLIVGNEVSGTTAVMQLNLSY